MIEIRRATAADQDAIATLFREMVSQGDVFAFPASTSREEALQIWAGEGMTTFVAVRQEKVVGSYYLKPNQPGLGAHVANAGFMVWPSERGRGVGQALGEHALQEAAHQGYRAMQFNFVVSTNTSALRLWQRLGFAVVGTVPQAFRHPRQGLVDVHIMHRFL